MRRKRLLTSAILLGLSLGVMATCSTESIGEEVHTTKLTLHPTAAPVPALKYRLLPTYFEKKPGNAATLYQRAITEYLSRTDQAERTRQEKQCYEYLDDMPIGEIPIAKAKALLPGNSFLQLLDDAALRDQCDWGLSMREENPFAMPLPHLHPMRSIFRRQQLETRCYLAEGKLKKAFLNIRNEFSIGQHIAKPPILICGIVGIALSEIACADLEAAIQQPDSPNLYWSLTQLPRPLISLQKSLQVEGDIPCTIMPELRNVEDDSLGADYWRKAFIDANDRMVKIGVGTFNGPERALGVTVLILATYPKARQSLIDDWGYTAEQIDAMPTAQVVALHTLKTYEAIRDEQFKWLALPNNEWKESPAELMKPDWKTLREKESLPLASILLPAVTAAKSAEIRLTQTIDRLRLIEAIRLYAYHHDGQLPERLEQITEVPVPVNPATGEPFSYCVEGDTAIIESTRPNRPKPIERYEIQIAK